MKTVKTKRFIDFILILMLMLVIFALWGNISVSADTYNGTCGENLTWMLDTGTGVLTISGTGDMQNWNFRDGAPWYKYEENLRTVILSDGVTSIGSNAFYECSSLVSVEIPDSVTSIGDSAFWNCSSLASIEIPYSVTSIGSNAFYECSSLVSVEIPYSVTSIGSDAFYGCSSLLSVEIPDSVTSIGIRTFNGCNSLASVVIGNGITSIGIYAFNGCSSLTSIEIPDSIISIEGGAFYDCSSLLSVVIPDSVTSIGGSTFSGCTNLASVVIPDSVTSIGSGAFYGCSSLVSVIIPDSVTSSIGDSAFSGCSKLVSIEISDSVTSIGDGAFWNCSSLASIEIPDSVTSIGRSAFQNCSSLTSIEIPDSVTSSIGDSAFSGCSSLASIEIPDSVTSIGRSAFQNCSSLTSIEIPDSVTSIGSGAFYGCSSLVSVIIPDSVTSIGSSAFQNCSSLVSVEISDSVASIGQYAFQNCSNLKSITVDVGNTDYMSDNGVLYNKSQTQIICYPARKIEPIFTIPASVTSIGSSAFQNCSSLVSVEIPDSVTSIGQYAFLSCSKLAVIIVPPSVESIGIYAFNSENVIVYCQSNSFAHKYVVENQIRFLTATPPIYNPDDNFIGTVPNDIDSQRNPNLTTVQAVKPVKSTENDYLSRWGSLPGLQTIVNTDGSISVLDIENSIVYEYFENGEFVKTQNFEKELNMVGAFAKDKDGNYYIFYAASVDENNRTEKNMALIKYSPSGLKLKEFWLEAYSNDSFIGVKEPFHAGTCRLEISGEMIAVYFARLMFEYIDGLNHQASYGFVLDINTFERLTGDLLTIPYVSHSFNQFILPTDNGFVIADHGDAYPRSFAFEKVSKFQLSGDRIESFIFKGGRSSAVNYNWTFTEMGGLAKTPNGYIFAGAYEKNDIVQDYNNDSRNMFVLTMDEDLTTISDPIWITNYTDKYTETAVTPKIVRIDKTKYLLLWEVYNPTSESTKTYKAVIDDKGEIITPAEELVDIKLNGYDVLRYNTNTGLVYWSTSDGDGEIKLWSLNPLADYASPISAGTKKGDVVNTNLTVSINGNKIPAYNIGNMAVCVEDLKNYGFNVEYTAGSQSYNITDFDKNEKVLLLSAEKNTTAPGTKKGECFYTDKKVYVNGNRVNCYEADEKIIILVSDLKPLVEIYIKGNANDTVISDVKNELSDAKVYEMVNGAEVEIKADNRALGTGMIVRNGAEEIVIFVTGDLTGKGNPNIEDAQVYLESLVGNTTLDKAHELAIDGIVNKNETSAIKKLRCFLNAIK